MGTLDGPLAFAADDYGDGDTEIDSTPSVNDAGHVEGHMGMLSLNVLRPPSGSNDHGVC